MIYTPMTKKAIKLMFELHKEQTDKSGLPYVFHPFHLAEQMGDENTCCAALLHDTIEDTPCTLEELRAQGFSEDIVEAVGLLTHPEGEEYLHYVSRIGKNPIARAVKLADLRHNSDITRLDEVREKDLQRVEKYKKAIALLEELDAADNK